MLPEHIRHPLIRYCNQIPIGILFEYIKNGYVTLEQLTELTYERRKAIADMIDRERKKG